MPSILVSDRVQIVMPYHILFDKLEEQRLGGKSFGSTKSGIAPFYSDKYAKIGIQAGELYDDRLLMDRLVNLCEIKNAMIRELYKSSELLDPQAIYSEVTAYRDRLEPMLVNAAVYLHRAKDKSILLEGQLGALKDPDNGIYPFVTSSSPLAGFGTVGAGIAPNQISEVITVVKSYSSCVGAGAFVSEIFGEEAESLRKRGGDAGEYGATTGRPRRMGWFDAVATKYGCMLQGTTQVALSLLDVLGYLDTIPVCTGYEIDGEVTDTFPITPLLNKAKPVYEYLNGWKCDISGIRSFGELPGNARKYVEFIEERIGYPIRLISDGPKRNDFIIR
jgi:adenylosuccinate synthase